jgi:hypothetical protein
VKRPLKPKPVKVPGFVQAVNGDPISMLLGITEDRLPYEAPEPRSAAR